MKQEITIQPKISIIVPVYNVESYLKECLDSCVKQTLSDIEIIVVNDGSTDTSSIIVDQYAREYPQIIRAFHKSNGGLSDARNFGIDHAKGEYLAFVDSDDWIDRTMFQQLYEKAVQTDSDVVVCGWFSFYENGRRKLHPIKQNGSIEIFNHSILEKPEILFASKSYPWNKIFRRTLFTNNRHRFPVGQWFEDSAIIYNILADANRIACVPKCFYHYRALRDGAITNSLDNRIFDIFKSCESIRSYYQEKGIYNQSNRVLEQVICSHLFARLNVLFTNKEIQMARRYIRRSFRYLENHFPGWRKRYQFRGSKIEVILLRTPLNEVIVNGYLFVPKSLLSIAGTIKTKILEYLNKKKNSVIRHIKKKMLHRYGYHLLEDLNRVFKSASVPYFVDFGTLLGMVRDNGFIAHDIDIDLGVIATKKQQIMIRKALQDAGHKLWRTYRIDDNIVQESYHYMSWINKPLIRFDINYYVNDDEYSKTWLFYREPDTYYPPGIRNVVELVYSRIEKISTLQIKGHTIPVPYNAQRILEEKYGPNWKVPDPNWIYWNSPSARKLDKLGIY